MSKKKEMSIEEKLKDALIEVEEQPYQLPENWEWVRLGSVCEKITDGSHNPPKSKEFGIPMLSAKNIQDGNLDFSNVDRLISEEEFLKENQRTNIEYDDILLTIVGTIGRTCLIKEKHPKFALQRSVAVIRPKFQSEYINFIFNSPLLKELMKKKSKGTAQLGIYLNALKELTIPLPPLAEQNRIVEKLDSMLGKIKEAKELIAEARETFQNRRASILDKAFRGELTEKWRAENEGGDATLLLEKINEEKMKKWEEECLEAEKNGKKKPSKPKLSSPEEMLIPEEEQPYQLPEGWQWVKTNSIIDVRDGTHDSPIYTESGYPLVTSKNLKNGEIDFINTNKISKEDLDKINQRSKVEIGDILYAMIGTIGNPVLVNVNSIDSFAIKNVALFKPYDKQLSKLYLYYLMSYQFSKEIESKIKGTTQKFIPLNVLREVNFPLPPLAEQEEIVKIVESLLKAEEEVADLLDMESSIELLEKSILDRAFRGELGTGDESDEPALEMLKRIMEK